MRPVTNPVVLLELQLDQRPNAILDQICGLLSTIQQHTGVTVLHITHSMSEANRLADCLLRIEEGQVTTPANQETLPSSQPTVEPEEA